MYNSYSSRFPEDNKIIKTCEARSCIHLRTCSTKIMKLTMKTSETTETIVFLYRSQFCIIKIYKSEKRINYCSYNNYIKRRLFNHSIYLKS